MLGFTKTPQSIDWSYYGGAEELPPSMRKRVAAAAGSSSSLSAGRAGEQQQRAAASGATASASTMSSSSCSSTRSSAENSSDDDDAASGSAITLDEDIDTALSGGLKDEAAASLANAPGHAWAPAYATTQQDASDFLWMLTEEPHRTRRMAILKAHPEVRTLMGHEPLTRYLSAAVVVLQLAIAVGLAQAGVHPLDWRFLLTAYVVGGTANQNIFLAIHEITHNLAFRGIAANKLWAIFVNAPIGVPYAMMFKKYHIEHHKHLGEEGVDTDLPTRIELACLQNVLGKAFFATFQIFFYALRPGFVRTQRLTPYHLANAAFQVALDVLMVKYVGWTALLYLLESSFFAGSLHPCAAHFIAEHYMFGGIQQETWSYYGPLNALAYNVGYHNEHHDFPSVPWTRLPALRRMAPEFYDVLPHHTSWPLVTLQFILGEDSGLFARIKRRGKGEARKHDSGKAQSGAAAAAAHTTTASSQQHASGDGEGNALE